MVVLGVELDEEFVYPIISFLHVIIFAFFDWIGCFELEMCQVCSSSFDRDVIWDQMVTCLAFTPKRQYMMTPLAAFDRSGRRVIKQGAWVK